MQSVKMKSRYIVLLVAAVGSSRVGREVAPRESMYRRQGSFGSVTRPKFIFFLCLGRVDSGFAVEVFAFCEQPRVFCFSGFFFGGLGAHW